MVGGTNGYQSDVVPMFSNIDNNLGISAVRKSLDSRSVKFPSTECIVETIEICLQTNNCQFSGKKFCKNMVRLWTPKTHVVMPIWLWD